MEDDSDPLNQTMTLPSMQDRLTEMTSSSPVAMAKDRRLTYVAGTRASVPWMQCACVCVCVCAMNAMRLCVS